MSGNTITKEKGYISIENNVYLIALGVFLCTGILALTLWGVDGLAFKLLRYACYLVFGVKVVSIPCDRDKLTLGIVLAVCMALSFLHSRDVMLVIYFLLLFGAYGVDHKNILKVYIVAQSMIVGATTILSQLGVVEDFVDRNVSWPERILRVRHFIGFDYTTTGPIMFFFAICSYICIREGRLKFIEYAVGTILTVVMYIFTDTSFAFYVSVAILNICYVGQYIIAQGRIVYNLRKLVYLTPWVAAITAIGAQYFYNDASDIWGKINTITHGRLSLGNSAIEKYGFNLFGHNINWIGSSRHEMSPIGYNYVDSSYLQVALNYGVVVLVILLALYSLVLYKAIKAQRYYMVWVVLMVLVLSLTEPRLFNLLYNPFILLAFANMKSIDREQGKSYAL